MTDRHIKFRQWDGEKFHYWGFVARSFIAPIHSRDNGIGYLGSQQYTELLDKNGVEIYEGDIVKAWSGDFWMQKDKTDVSRSEPELFYVKWDEKESQWTTENDNKGAGWYPAIKDSPGRPLFEVIGNIYKNPELLK